jgi:hypothetical protein
MGNLTGRRIQSKLHWRIPQQAGYSTEIKTLLTAYTDAREVYSLIEEYDRSMKNQNRLLKKLWP